MKPYLEVKVVKVSKPKEKVFRCKTCGIVLPAEQKKGNWVNGENLDKIKFPCWCKFDYFGERLLGQINHSKVGDLPYQIVNITEQDDTNVYRASDSLRELIETHNIKILKAKIILFEEE